MTRSWDDMSQAERLDAVAALTSHFGLSAREIADELGTTKNTICGMWHRHPHRFQRERWVGDGAKILKRAAFYARAKLPEPAGEQQSQPKPVKPKRPPQGELIAEGIRARKAPVSKPKAAPMPVAFVLPPPLPRVLPPPPDPRGHTLFTVSPFQCRYPLFDDAKKSPLTEMFVCGDVVDGECSYCAEHRELTRRPEPLLRIRVPS